MISAGALATHITAVSAEDGPFAKILAACIPIIIFLMIPAALKASGSIMNYVGGTVMGRANGYSKAIRSSAMMKNAKQDFRERAALTIDENRDLNNELKGFGKARAATRREVGRLASGHTFSRGKMGKLHVAKSVNAARHHREEAIMNEWRENGMDNVRLAQMAQAGLWHEHNGKPVKHGQSIEVEDAYGKKWNYKVDHHLAEAAVSMLAEQGGMVELSELFDGKKARIENGKFVPDPEGTFRDPSKALFNRERNQWKNKEVQATMSRALGSNAGAVLQKITHAVHLQGTKAYGDLKAGNIANLGAGSGITAAQEGVKWNPVNALTAVMDIVNSGALASTVQNDVMRAYRRELMKAYEEGKFGNFTTTVDGYPGVMDVKQFLETFVGEGGQVTVSQGNVKRDNAELNRILTEEVLPQQKIYDAEIKAKRAAGPEGH